MSRKRRFNARRAAFWLHNLLGLKASVLLAFVCFTGTIATVSNEIEWLFMPDIRASQYAPGEEDWGAMWAAAQRVTPPGDRVASLFSYGNTVTTHFVKKAYTLSENRRPYNIYVDPGSNTVTAIENTPSFQDIMRGLHYYLLIPGDLAFFAVVSMGLVLMASLITGLISYKKFWRGFFKKPRWTQDLRILMSDLHRSIGLWSLWIAIIMSVTSLWYILERAGLDLNSTPPSIQALAPDRPLEFSEEDINSWVQISHQAMPGLQVTAVNLPPTDGGLASVQGQWQAHLVRERANKVFIDPVNGRVVNRQVAHHMSIGERIVHTADPLHFGNFGGLVSKLVYFIFGLALTSMAVTGAALYSKRIRLARETVGLLHQLNYLGVLKWPSLIIVTIVPFFIYLFGWR